MDYFVSYASRSGQRPPQDTGIWSEDETEGSHSAVMPGAAVTRLLSRCGLLGAGRVDTDGKVVMVSFTDDDQIVGVRARSPDMSDRGLAPEQWELANYAAANGWLPLSWLQRLKRLLGF